MNKQLFLKFIYEYIKDNPEWMSEAVMLMNKGILDRLHEERIKTLDVETAFINSFKTKKDKELILKGLKSLRCYGGTKFQEDKIKQYEK